MKNKLFLMLIVAVFGTVFFINTVSAATIFTDSFESYNVGGLNRQGDWTANSWVAVQSSYVKDGGKAIKMFDYYYVGIDAKKTGNLLNDGEVTVSFRLSNTLYQIFTLFLDEGSDNRIEVRFHGGSAYYHDGSKYVVFNNYSNWVGQLVWHSIQVQWRSQDHTARYKLNGGEWTEWLPTKAAWSEGLDTVHFRNKESNAYVDAIRERLLGDKNPVLIVPGILGSAEKDGQWIIDPILHTYDNLVDTFKANGYEDGQTLFTFPYNWYQSNVLTAIQLKDKINSIKSICGYDKVDIVAHSMGGLVAREYIESTDYQDDIDKLIFLGTPHLGAPKDYLLWEAGELDKGILDQLLKIFLSSQAKKAGYSSIFDYVRSEPIFSVRELLPIYNYLVDANPLVVRQYPTGYPLNSFLETLNDNLPILENSGVEVFNITGNAGDVSTINYIRVVPSDKLPLWENGYPEGFDERIGDMGIIMGVGDGTVPFESSNIFTDTVSINSIHSSLPTNAEIQVLTDLLGQGQYTAVNNANWPDFKLLIIKLLSPVDMQIVSPSGQKIGKDFNTSQEINQIPYAFYSGFNTDDEYITIVNPEDGQYKIITQGTGNGGEYTVASALISDTQSTEQDFTGHTTLGQIENINLNLSSSSGEIIITPEDIISPEIIVNSPAEQNYLHSESFNIDYSASDEGSGLFSSSAKLDNINVENGENIDLFFQSLGSHIFTVTAKDNVGNQASSTASFDVIATVESTISDINRAYDLGWITKKSTKDNLIKKINNATKIVGAIQKVEQKLFGKPKVADKIQKIEKRLDKTLSRLMIINLTVLLKTKAINQQAYDVISADINWLINN